MYFDFMYGLLFDGRIITRKTRKSHRNTENIEILLSVCCTSPAPTRNQRKSTEFTKRGQGRRNGEILSLSDIDKFGILSFKILRVFVDAINPCHPLHQTEVHPKIPETSRLRPIFSHTLAHAQTFGLVASLSTCSAEVVCFASNPP